MKEPRLQEVAVDMVPLIDVVCLLLIFLVIVGDVASTASNLPMKLPRADQAMRFRNEENRIVVQLRRQDAGRYEAVVNNRAYALTPGGGNKSLLDYLDQQIQFALSQGFCSKDSHGAVSSPVKLRIPEDCPMTEVEKVVMTMATVGLVNVRYAAATE
jgi:biopolymer transport protein ExbD